jgi:hypothetical protein
MISKRRMIERIGTFAEGGCFIWGLLFDNWSPILAVAGYWMEEAIIFLLTVIALIRIKIIKGSVIHLGTYVFVYGFFFFIHTVFFLILAGMTANVSPASDAIINAFFHWITGSTIYFSRSITVELMIIFTVVLAGSIYTMHFRTRSGDPGDIINLSFGPLIAMHFLLIFGNGVIMLTGAPFALAAVLVAIKILIDLSGFADKGSPIIAPEEK